MDRRTFLAVVTGSVLAPSTGTAAEPGKKIPKVGVVTPYKGLFDAVVVPTLRDLGYVDGQNISFVILSAEGNPDKYPELVAELVRLNVDVIVVTNNSAAIPAKEATRTIPIVVAVSHDAVGTGLAASLARPGGNVTGGDSLAPELDAKRIEFLHQVVPRLARLAVIYNPVDRGMVQHLRQTNAAAQQLGMKVQPLEVRNVAEFETAFAVLRKARPDGLLEFTETLIFAERKRIIAFAAEHRIPAVYEYRAFVVDGGLLSYGPNLTEMYRRSATYVDKILKGAKPGDLPVELPTKFELVINLKTAKALGLTIPQSLLLRADEVIQ